MKNVPARNPIFWAIFLLTLGIALGLRLPDLSRKPMHTDEAVQAVKAGELLEHNFYRYDPHEFHGPTLYYFTQPVLKLCGVKSLAESNEIHYRIVPAIFGVGLIFLLLLIADGIGTTAVICVGFLTAVSPAFVFFSRYYIQEILLVFFSFAAIACAWRWMNGVGKWRWVWAALCGLSVGLMHATKETCVIALAGMLVGQTFLSARKSLTESAVALGVAMLVSITLFSSFFTNARGPLDSILTYGTYLSRGTAGAAESSHDKPWDYYARLILWNRSALGVWSESFIVALACIGAAASFLKTKNSSLARFFVVYTAVLAVAYSALSYKTPWCVLGMLHGLIILAGVGAAAILELCPRIWMKSLAATALLAGAGHLAWQAQLAAFKFSSDTRNPYVYVHPTPDAVRVCERIEALARVHPDGLKMPVQVMAPKADYWPVPWYLRRMERVGFWSAPPADLSAPVLLAAPEFIPELRLELKGKYQINAYGLRPGVIMWLYVEEGLWKKYLATNNAKSRRDE